MTDALKPCPFCGSAPGTLARPDNIDGTEFYAAVFCHCEGYSATAHAGRRGKTQDEATSAAHAAWNRRAAIAAPPGWVLAPVKATETMCKAAVIYANGNAVYSNVAAEALKIEEAIYGEAYAAMLAAAPDAPQSHPQR